MERILYLLSIAATECFFKLSRLHKMSIQTFVKIWNAKTDVYLKALDVS